MNLENKTIIVTGCSSGIGAETAKQLKAQGATVIGFDLKEPSENVDQYIAIDLNDTSAIEAAVVKFDSKADALCNIAGVPPTLPALVQINVNFFGLRTFTKLMMPKLNESASIVNLASIAGGKYMQRLSVVKQLLACKDGNEALALMNEHGIDEVDAYNFSKEGVILWTMKMAPICRSKGLSIKSLSPGPVQTPILQDFLDTIAKKQVEPPIGFEADPKDIAAFVCFLCGEGGRWMNGQDVTIDGGLKATRMGEALGL